MATRAGVDPEVAHFALADLLDCRHDTGSNRNALLLAHIGHAFVSSDDDVLCEPRLAPDNGSWLHLTGKSAPTRVRLFGSVEEANAAHPITNACVFAAHEALLGKSVGALLAARPASATKTDDLGSGTRRALVAGKARVSVTSSGIVGDCAARFPDFYLWEPEVRSQLQDASFETYRSLVESRQISRSAATLTIASSPFLMSTHLAFAGDVVLPPFFPVLRGIDAKKRCHQHNQELRAFVLDGTAQAKPAV
ncbi:MAG TPA: hypothetical protein VGG33_24260 [Polyangia bacterium]